MSSSSVRSLVATTFDTKNSDPNRFPQPSHRHATPSGLWPWMDMDDEADPDQLSSSTLVHDICNHEDCDHCWRGYPQSRFPEWTLRRRRKSKIATAMANYQKENPCVLYKMDVDSAGIFHHAGFIEAKYREEEKAWYTLLNDERPKDLRVRALFIKDLSGPVLQMLGTMYNIKPFFWSSSLNWIPSRSQEEVLPGVGDHITITLTFLRSLSNHDAQNFGAALGPNKLTESLKQALPSTLLGSQKIDTQAPLVLYPSNRLLVLDLLAVHLIRNNQKGNTIISYHSNLNVPTTTANYLHERICFAGQSVYWLSLFRHRPEPTFVLLIFMWHALYAWDEALENLYQHICSLESRVIETTEMSLAHELRVIRAHHLHYHSLLEDFAKHVNFVKDIPNPAMTHEEQEHTKYMELECGNLISGIERLTEALAMQERRLENVMSLVLSFVNIKDSRSMREMMEATVRQSAVAYLMMVYLPASFIGDVFGMNILKINPGTLGTAKLYVGVTLPLTFVTIIWILIAFQSKYIFKQKKTLEGWAALRGMTSPSHET